MDLRPELLRTEQNEAEVAATLRNIEQHLPDVGVGSIARCVFVELVDEDDEMLDPQIPPLQMLAELGDDASEDEVLRIFLEVGDIHDVHRPVGKAPEGEIAHRARVGDESRTASGDIGETIPNFADRGNVMGAPALSILFLHPLQHIAEPRIEIGK